MALALGLYPDLRAPPLLVNSDVLASSSALGSFIFKLHPSQKFEFTVRGEGSQYGIIAGR